MLGDRSLNPADVPIYTYRFSNYIQVYDNKPSTFRLNHFRGIPSERPVTYRKRRMQAVGAKSGAVLRTRSG